MPVKPTIHSCSQTRSLHNKIFGSIGGSSSSSNDKYSNYSKQQGAVIVSHLELNSSHDNIMSPNHQLKLHNASCCLDLVPINKSRHVNQHLLGLRRAIASRGCNELLVNEYKAKSSDPLWESAPFGLFPSFDMDRQHYASTDRVIEILDFSAQHILSAWTSQNDTRLTLHMINEHRTIVDAFSELYDRANNTPIVKIKSMDRGNVAALGLDTGDFRVISTTHGVRWTERHAMGTPYKHYNHYRGEEMLVNQWHFNNPQRLFSRRQYGLLCQQLNPDWNGEAAWEYDKCHLGNACWDFWETQSSFLAMCVGAGADHLLMQVRDGRKAQQTRPDVLIDNSLSSDGAIVDCCFVSEDVLASIDSSHTVKVWDIRSPSKSMGIGGLPSYPHSKVYTHDSKRLSKEDGMCSLKCSQEGHLLIIRKQPNPTCYLYDFGTRKGESVPVPSSATGIDACINRSGTNIAVAILSEGDSQIRLHGRYPGCSASSSTRKRKREGKNRTILFEHTPGPIDLCISDEGANIVGCIQKDQVCKW
jgi:WD40 repeat protein